MSATYVYKVRDKTGKVITGEVEAASSTAVVRGLREKGMTPLSVQEKKSNALQMEIKIPGLSGRIKVKDVAIFSRQFATMVNSGLSLIRALSVLADQTENPALASVIEEVRGEVEKGTSLSQAMEKHPKAFGRLYVAMIRAGEVGGVLDETLDRLADMMEASVNLRSKVKSAMAYPVVVFGLVVVITIAMIIFVVPMFENLYSDLGGDLPLPTKFLIGASNIITTYWYIVVGVLVGTVVAFVRWKKTKAGLAVWDATKLKIPVFGKLVHKTAISRFARTLSVLSRSGVPILQAIDIVSETSGNEVLKSALLDVQQSIKGGDSIAGPLEEHSVFPPMVVQMMAVGEETGALDTMLAKVADFYEREVDDAVNALTSLIEPLLIIVMGSTVGGILIALYLPMFNVANLIQ